VSEGDGIGTADDLHAAATKITGLAAFGADNYRDGLAVLLDSYARDASLTAKGTRVTRALLRGALVARLLSEAAWAQHPEYADVGIEQPVFVTGLPRTGTTALHRLLTADPANQGLEVWLTQAPQPRPPRETWASNPVFQYIQAGFERHHVSYPEFMAVHYMAADQVEECWQLLRQSMRSISYECLAHLPGYSSWLAGQDWTAAYRRHRRNLQLIGLPDAGRRWVLKNPSHLFALDALLQVYPDALVIQTHRAPREAIASVCTLAAQVSAGWSTTFGGEVIGRDQLETWARGLDCFTAVRAARDPHGRGGVRVLRADTDRPCRGRYARAVRAERRRRQTSPPLRAGRFRAHRRAGRRAVPGCLCLTPRAPTGPAGRGQRPWTCCPMARCRWAPG
jgi:Sulfotransferase family